MNATKPTGSSPWRLLWGVLIALVISVSGAQAQTFYGFYGDHTSFSERGFKRVIPVLNCIDTDSLVPSWCNNNVCVPAQNVQANGYIAVGFSDMASQGLHDDVYVVRTNNDGRTVWEKTYDIGGKQLNDSAWSIVEVVPQADCPDACFAIVGTTEKLNAVGGIDTDIFLMVIDASGNVLTTATYDNNNLNDYGRDIIQAQWFLNAPPVPGFPIPPRAGDLVFCGWTDNTPVGGTNDGVIIRTNCAGVQAWNVQHDILPGPPPNVSDEVFLSLTESLFHPNPANNGDILVAGIFDGPMPPINPQGLVGRVLGATGLVGAIPTGFSSTGGAGVEEFHSIIELTSGLFGPPGDIIVVGSTNSPTGGGPFDVYIRQYLNGDPCAAGPDVAIGDGSPAVNDEGRDVREVIAPGLFAPPGHLLVTGFTDRNGGDDVFLLEVMPGPAPAPFWRLYGDFGTGDDQGISLADVDALNGRTRGVIMCGWTNSNICGSGTTDDLFLVKTDQNGNVQDFVTGCICVQEVDILWQHPNYNWTCYIPNSVRPYNDMQWITECRCWDTDIICCYTSANNLPPAPMIDPNLENGPLQDRTIQEERDLSRSMIRSRPAPVQGGEVLNLNLVSRSKSTINITVVDAEGKEVFRRVLSEVDGPTNLALSTEGWPSGEYLLKAGDGRRIDAVRVSVSK